MSSNIVDLTHNHEPGSERLDDDIDEQPCQVQNESAKVRIALGIAPRKIATDNATYPSPPSPRQYLNNSLHTLQ